jgi:hypothetical protein
VTNTDPGLSLRIVRHREIERDLRDSSDADLVRRLSDAGAVEHGHGTISVRRGDANVFVKLVPLTALEAQPRHRHSTANLFRLPVHYHYRLGGLGHGAWRELEVHRRANPWVLDGQSPHFVLLHHARVLPIVSRGADDTRSLAHWGGDPAIERRVSAVEEATSSIALFLEHFPRTLGQDLRERPNHALDPAATEARLLGVLSFLKAQGVLHMDVHLENVLTDGDELFLTDHGLVLSRAFHLDAEEVAFFERHENFDRCTAITGLVHALVARHDARPDWRAALRELLEGTHARREDVPAASAAYLVHRGPVALAMGDFYRLLKADLATEYPASRLQELLDGDPR